MIVGPDMPTMTESAVEFQCALENVVDFSSPSVKSKPPDIPHVHRLLEMCKRVATLIVPPDPSMTMPVLNHLDLTRENLIVPAEGAAYVLNTIDWQGATVLPF